MKRFWVHSYKARREREQREAERNIAHASLAGWRFVETPQIYGRPQWWLYSPDGNYMGMNGTIEGAAAYAVHIMRTRTE